MAPVVRRGPTIIRELLAPLVLYRLAPRAQRAYLGLITQRLLLRATVSPMAPFVRRRPIII